jgi:hypothetical protein
MKPEANALLVICAGAIAALVGARLAGVPPSLARYMSIDRSFADRFLIQRASPYENHVADRNP